MSAGGRWAKSSRNYGFSMKGANHRGIMGFSRKGAKILSELWVFLRKAAA